MDQRDWDELIQGKIRRLLYMEIPLNTFSWYGNSGPNTHSLKIDELVEKIAWDVKQYCNKLADDVCKQHHEGGEHK